jgi:hypothetical protein
VESLRRWWNGAGQAAYPAARRLLVTADAGGSSGYRTRAWKTELAALALETGLTITVCHFPPGTSKWNAIEHRLFSHISMNWRGRPLASHEVIIAATTTRTGLRVHAELDPGTYPTGTAVTGDQLAALPWTATTGTATGTTPCSPKPPAPTGPAAPPGPPQQRRLVPPRPRRGAAHIDPRRNGHSPGIWRLRGRRRRAGS